MNIRELLEKYQDNGYDYEDAGSKVCQDIILLKLSNSKFSKHITIKGGVVIHNISNDMRRATRDLDLDFIKYSLEYKAIKEFIDVLNNINDGVSIAIVGKIKPLHHQDYDGKRVSVRLEDENKFRLEMKLDIGVHKLFDIAQDEYCFNLDIVGKNANLLINSKEQIFTEKLKSLLKLGARSTRYKDLFDFYYLINEAGLNKEKLYNCIKVLIYNDETMRERNMAEIIHRLQLTLNSDIYKNNLLNPKVNWLNISIDEAIENVLYYLKNIEKILV